MYSRDSECKRRESNGISVKSRQEKTAPPSPVSSLVVPSPTILLRIQGSTTTRGKTKASSANCWLLHERLDTRKLPCDITSSLYFNVGLLVFFPRFHPHPLLHVRGGITRREGTEVIKGRRRKVYSLGCYLCFRRLRAVFGKFVSKVEQFVL